MLVLAISPLTAQVLDPTDDGRPQPGDLDYDETVERRERLPPQRETAAPDTFGIYRYRAGNPYAETAFRDSLLDQFQRFEPDRRVDFDYGTLGQIGSAAYPLKFAPNPRRGLTVGYRQYDLYLRDGDNVDYYRLQRPFTYLDYVRGSEQNDGRIIARFSRNFADGVNLLIDYENLTQTGARDQYPASAIEGNTHVTTAIAIRPPGRRYSGYFSYSANTFAQRQNGGIRDFNDPVVNPEIDNLAALNPFLEQTRIRHAYRQVMATNYLQFGGRVDTLTGAESRAYTLRYRAVYDQRDFRLSSQAVVNDTAFYNRFPALLTDPRGNRSFREHNTLENGLTLSTFRRGTSGARETVQRDVLEAGLIHQYHTLDGAGITNLLATGRIGLRPNDRLSVEIDGQLNLVGQTGDYRLGATGELDLGRLGKLELNFLNQLYAPDVVFRNYSLSGETIYDTNFGKSLDLTLGGAYTIPILDVRAGLNYHLFTDYLYFNTEGLPEQSDDVISLVQLTLERNFSFGDWRSQNRLLLQQSDNDAIRLPQLYGEHSIYYAGKWFGVLNVNAGIDVRFSTGFQPYYYNPIIQQFQLQDRQSTNILVQVDPFFSLRVTRFRFFVKMIQANTFWSSERRLFLAAENPYPNAAVRFGVSWRLLD